MSPQIQALIADQEFVSESYHGRQVATFHHGQEWLVYIDRVMQPDRLFACAEDALRWLHRKVDDATFDARASLGRRPGARRRSVMAVV